MWFKDRHIMTAMMINCLPFSIYGWVFMYLMPQATKVCDKTKLF